MQLTCLEVNVGKVDGLAAHLLIMLTTLRRLSSLVVVACRQAQVLGGALVQGPASRAQRRHGPAAFDLSGEAAADQTPALQSR